MPEAAPAGPADDADAIAPPPADTGATSVEVDPVPLEPPSLTTEPAPADPPSADPPAYEEIDIPTPLEPAPEALEGCRGATASDLGELAAQAEGREPEDAGMEQVPTEPRDQATVQASRYEATPTFDAAIMRVACKFDRKGQRIVDFELPDLSGQPVRFQDIQSELILIDFWGTWCGPCVRAIPRLVELQERFGPETLRVVGIAYELEGSPQDRAVGVSSVARRLGINYPLLLGEADGEPCPLQAALHVQTYPTLVLVDREGRIQWRGTGADERTLQTLARVIESRAASPRTRRPAALARDVRSTATTSTDRVQR